MDPGKSGNTEEDSVEWFMTPDHNRRISKWNILKFLQKP